MLIMKRLSVVLMMLVMVTGCSFATKEGVVVKPKVLYVTFEPGKYHKYTPQLKIVREVIAPKGNWQLDVITGGYDEVVGKLRKKDFAKGYDAVVYNYCFAHSKDLDACDNIINQTRKGGVNAMMIHCAMHSFWPTFKHNTKVAKGALGKSYTGKGTPTKEAVAAWQKDHGDAPFPVYGDFTGIASFKHGPKKPIKLIKLKDHPTTKNVPADYATAKAELYNNGYVIDNVVPLLKGVQAGKNKKGKPFSDEAVVMWTTQQGKGELLGLTLGHAEPEWEDPVFQTLIVDSVNYLAGVK